MNIYNVQNDHQHPRKKQNNKKGPFSIHFDECLESLELRKNGKRMKKEEIGALLGISKWHFKKYINTLGLARRDCIIAIGFALWLNSNQTDDLLLRYGMPQLDEKIPRESEIKRMLNVAVAELNHGKKKVDDFSLESINQELRDLNMEPLHVVDKKNGKRETDEPISTPQEKYILLEQKTETRIDEIVLGEWYDSLMTEYYPGRYRIASDYYIESVDGRSGHRIVVEPGSNNTYSEMLVEEGKAKGDNSIEYGPKLCLLQWDYPTSNGLATSFNSIEETGDLKPFYKIAYNKAIQERIRLTQVLNDSKNYQDRISAKVIDGEIHVFTETYNYDYPETGEYYLMDYCSNKFIFSVEKESCFMLLYLSQNEYLSYFEKLPIRGEEKYESVEEIKKKRAEEKDPVLRIVLGSRLTAFIRMKQRIEEFIPKLNTTIFIRHPDIAVDEEINLFDYYETQPDGIYREEELLQAFTLGLDSLNEIELYRQKSRTPNINEK